MRSLQTDLEIDFANKSKGNVKGKSSIQIIPLSIGILV